MLSLVASLALALTPAPIRQDTVDLSELSRTAMGESPVDGAIFDEIGEVRTKLALNTLLICCDTGPRERRPTAIHAVRHFAGADELEERAIEYLAAKVLHRDTTIYESRACARALTAFGRASQDHLERIVVESEDPTTRQWAIGGLVDLLRVRRSADALQLLIEDYRPPFSGSIEDGVKALATFRDEASLETMRTALTKSRADADAREMLARAIARRSSPEAVDALRRTLRDDNPFVLAAAIDGLRELGSTDQASKFAALTRNASHVVRMSAFRALTGVRYGEKGFDKKLRRALESSDFALRWGAVAGLGDARDDASAERIAERLGDEHPAVRDIALECALARRIKPAIPRLIEWLDADERLVRDRGHAALLELTGQDHGRTSKRWEAWWAGEGASFEVPEASAATAAIAALREAQESGPTRAKPKESSFYGVTFQSDRVVFVLDLSGSMLMDDRIGRMKTQLRDALKGIPTGGRFNMVFFTAKANPWGKRLVKMTPTNRKRADAAIGKLVADGWTNLHGGLAVAFSDPDVRTIVLLSDGEPSRGVIETGAILRDVRAWNHTRGVVIHTVSIGDIGSTGLMDALAMMTGGDAVTSF